VTYDEKLFSFQIHTAETITSDLTKSVDYIFIDSVTKNPEIELNIKKNVGPIHSE